MLLLHDTSGYTDEKIFFVEAAKTHVTVAQQSTDWATKIPAEPMREHAEGWSRRWIRACHLSPCLRMDAICSP